MALTCDHCNVTTGELYESTLCFTEWAAGETSEGVFSDVNVHLCEACTNAAEDWLAKFGGQQPPVRDDQTEVK
jgi:hypothetical protein